MRTRLDSVSRPGLDARGVRCRGGCRRSGRGAGPGGGGTGGCRRGRLGGAGFEVAQDVVLGDPAGEPAAGNGAQVEVVLRRHLADQRRGSPAEPLLGALPSVGGADVERPAGRGHLGRGAARRGDGRGAAAGAAAAAATVGAASRCRRLGRRGRCRGRGRRGRAAAAAPASVSMWPRRLHRDRLAFGHQDLGQHARGGRGNLGVDLVGRDLEDRLVPRDRVAHLLHPAREGALGDRLAHLRHDHINLGHSRSPVSTRQASARPGRCPASAAGRSPRAAARTAAARRARRHAGPARPAIRRRAR